MKEMDDYIRVRRMHEIDGLNISELHRKTGLHRDTIRKMVTEGGPPGYRHVGQRPRPVLGEFETVIEDMIKADAAAPRKQKHTATRIWKRLKEEHGYKGGYTQVCQYVGQLSKRMYRTYMPLQWNLATAQVDWGEAWALHDGQDRKVQLFVLTLPNSNVRFVAAFPRATQEFFFEGHRRAFEFLGGVPRCIVYDNLKSAVVQVKRGRKRVLNEAFERFAEYYLFESRFCNVASGNEKGHVEGGVKWAQRNLMVPVPQFSHWEELNERLAEHCRRFFDHTTQGHDKTVGQRFQDEREHLLTLPRRPGPPGKKDTWTVSSLCLVRFDTNDYSVPCEFAHGPVVVQADVSHIRITTAERIRADGPCIAVHRRRHDKGQAIYDPIHYLPLVERKPRTLNDGAPMRQLAEQLPECFHVLRRRLENDEEHDRGSRRFICVLRLLENHSLATVSRAVERAMELGVGQPEAIRNFVLCPPEAMPSRLDLRGQGHLMGYPVALPELSSYAGLVRPGGSS